MDSLIVRMLTVDPIHRVDIYEALRHSSIGALLSDDMDTSRKRSMQLD